MPDGQVLEFTNVTKRFNEVTAVSDFSARVEPGAVTAFLGPNGAGKTTTLRILLGQVRATSGTATIGGTAFAELRQPLRTVGSVLEDTVYRPRRTANRQLTIAAKANGIPLARVDEVLAMVGLEGEGDSRIGGFSLGMRQRLSVANAMLGDPGALVFDEPANGLDPEGIRWMRLLMRRLADEGRTVLVSSHVLSEVEQFADNVLVLSKGRLVLSSGIETLADPKAGSVVVDAADRAALTTALSAAGFDIEVLRSGLTVRGADAGTVGSVAAAAGIALSTLVQRGPTLEDVFIDLVRGGKLAPRAETTAPQLAAPVAAGAVAAEAEAFAAAPLADAAPLAQAVDGADVPSGSKFEDEASDGEASNADTSVAESGAVASDDASDDEAVVEPGEEAAEQSAVEEVSLVETLASDDDTAEHDGVSDEQNALGENEGGDADENQAADFSDAAESHETPASEDTASPRSFDEILFGTSVAAAPESTTDAATESETEAQVEVDHAGVEFFSELGETDAATESESADESELADQESDQQPAATEQSEEGDDDPRSAAVSSMLAAAARAYYEDEPKDYPQEAPSPEADGAQWTVASTGVIDIVPLADGSAPEGEADADHHEAHEGESHEHGDNHEHGENHHG